jgi:isoamylase
VPALVTRLYVCHRGWHKPARTVLSYSVTMTSSSRTDHGESFPLGPTVYRDGVNFSVFSKSSLLVELLLFERLEDAKPSRVLSLDPKRHRTYHYWHVFVHGLKPGQIYGYRAIGPYEPENGQRFDADKVLLDPYGRCVAVPANYSRIVASHPGNNTATAMKSVVADFDEYDWEGDRHPCTPFARTVIYEMHVAGFTRHPSSGVSVKKRGTYAGLIEKVPYLKDLGVTAVELLPIYQFDEQDAPSGLRNYWGYSPVSFFAPHVAYSSRRDLMGPLGEFRDMVKALHRAGIEVILDVVYNHTAEGGSDGPTICFKGLENEAYYILDNDKSRYADYTGTGNTLNGNQSIVRRMILDSLRHWVSEMHVDGFRFDLASILSRDESGHPLVNPPILLDIESDPVLASTKLIAEAWDAGGLYQVGSFAGDIWKEWNGKFRDDIRAFIKGDPGMVSRLPNRLLASPDLYGHQDREPEQSINFVTCHDGFTLNDLVSYDKKHNDDNKESNRDGSDHNLSWNCGAEGPTTDPAVEQIRNRQIKNFLTVTLSSIGVPMLSMGDEIRRTQLGNNNAYCQDNEISWFDWTFLSKYADIHRFVKILIQLRMYADVAAVDRDLSLIQYLHTSKIEWHGVKLHQPDWSDNSHTLSATSYGLTGKRMNHFVLNSYWEPLEFEIPALPAQIRTSWLRIIDTSLPSPQDISDPRKAPAVSGSSYLAQPRSIVLLTAKLT